ncbi:hypothetical protein Tco_0917926 [Tanacetum coccineum]
MSQRNRKQCSSKVHTHQITIEIERFGKRENSQAKNAEFFQSNDINESLLAQQVRLGLKEKYFKYLSVAKKASLVDKVAMFSAETKDIVGIIKCIRAWFPETLNLEETNEKNSFTYRRDGSKNCLNHYSQSKFSHSQTELNAPSTESLDSSLTGFRNESSVGLSCLKIFSQEDLQLKFFEKSADLNGKSCCESGDQQTGLTVYEDLEQIHEDDIEDMDLKWQANQVNAAKTSACWVWRPTKLNSASMTLKKHNYVDGRGRSKSLIGTCPISQTSRNLMKDMLPLGEEPNEEKLLMCDKKNSVIFTNTGCFVLSPDFKLTNESQVLLKVPRKNNMCSVDMKNIVPKESLTCLVAKATLDESMLWHEARFTWVFFLATKDETSGILKRFITKIENLVDKKVKIIRCDNGTEFKN